MKNNHIWKNRLLLLIALTGIISVLLLGPIAQNESYHAFADKRDYFSIPNFWNSISNIPLLGYWAFSIFSK